MKNSNKSLANLFQENDGAAAVELAITLPVLIFILAGVIMGGFGYYVKADMQQALSQTARYSMLNPGKISDDDLKVKIASYLVTPNNNITTVSITNTTSFKKMSITMDYISVFNYNIVLSNEIDIPI